VFKATGVIRFGIVGRPVNKSRPRLEHAVGGGAASGFVDPGDIAACIRVYPFEM
jgi:hypothetical protein